MSKFWLTGFSLQGERDLLKELFCLLLSGKKLDRFMDVEAQDLLFWACKIALFPCKDTVFGIGLILRGSPRVAV